MAAGCSRIALVFVVLACRLAVASAQPAIVQVELSNGLRLIMQEDHRLPRVGVAVSYAVGHRDDPPGRSGLAHLVEHAMCGPTLHVPEGIHVYFERLGAQATATTYTDNTLMAEELPSELWETALWLESDRMAFLLSVLDASELERIRAVVKRELEQRTGPDTSGNELITELYPEAHPYHLQAYDPSDADAVALDDVRWFFQRHYGPASAVLTVVGDFDPTRVEQAVRKYFGPIRPSRIYAPRQRNVIRTERLSSDREAVVLPRLNENWRWERLLIGWQTPPRFAPGDSELDIAATLLEQRLRTKLQVTQRVLGLNVIHPSWELSSPFVIALDILPPYSTDSILASVLAEVAKLGDSDADITRAQNRRATLRLRAADSQVQRAASLAVSATLGTIESVESIDQHYARVEAQAVRQAIETYLQRAKHVVVRREFSRFGSRPKALAR